MTNPTQPVFFSGLDPVPIRLTLGSDRSPDAIYTAAGIPPSHVIQTLQPYQVQLDGADTYRLSLGPQGFGAELLEALRWLAHVTAAGILNGFTHQQTVAFVQHYLEVDKPEWGYEELTEHAETFIQDRYHRVTTDTDYRQALESQRQNPALIMLQTDLRNWLAT